MKAKIVMKHYCPICKKHEKCKEEKCDFSNFLGCHSSCYAKNQMGGNHL